MLNTGRVHGFSAVAYFLCLTVLLGTSGCSESGESELDQQMNVGSEYYFADDFTNAVSSFDKAIEIDPNFAPAYTNRGLANIGLGELEKALADFNKSLEIDPEYLSAIRFKAECLDSLERKSEAAAARIQIESLRKSS